MALTRTRLKDGRRHPCNSPRGHGGLGHLGHSPQLFAHAPMFWQFHIGHIVYYMHGESLGQGSWDGITTRLQKTHVQDTKWSRGSWTVGGILHNFLRLPQYFDIIYRCSDYVPFMIWLAFPWIGWCWWKHQFGMTVGEILLDYNTTLHIVLPMDYTQVLPGTRGH